jgi:hypothetical protein
MIYENNYENTSDKKEQNKKQIEQIAPSAELGSSDEDRQCDNASKYGVNTRLLQVKPPWQNAAQDGTTKFTYTYATNEHPFRHRENNDQSFSINGSNKITHRSMGTLMKKN